MQDVGGYLRLNGSSPGPRLLDPCQSDVWREARSLGRGAQFTHNALLQRLERSDFALEPDPHDPRVTTAERAPAAKPQFERTRAIGVATERFPDPLLVRGRRGPEK